MMESIKFINSNPGSVMGGNKLKGFSLIKLSDANQTQRKGLF